MKENGNVLFIFLGSLKINNGNTQLWKNIVNIFIRNKVLRLKYLQTWIFANEVI